MAGRGEESKKAKVRRDGKAPAASSAAADAAANVNVSVNGEVMTISQYISRSEEVSRRRIGGMRQTLTDLEMQMEGLEAEMSKANGCGE
ncbi:hypothetical protein HPP92_023431 [Vanilla planifolia]|uniref:Uncharacterized protein n=1 Tax=Vanilla planifolia TaxID=51239 RepID=A0A835UCU4_VANPL|nr:hypothetical protein HPP92_023431 [Vanilla planifolia]